MEAADKLLWCIWLLSVVLLVASDEASRITEVSSSSDEASIQSERCRTSSLYSECECIPRDGGSLVFKCPIDDGHFMVDYIPHDNLAGLQMSCPCGSNTTIYNHLKQLLGMKNVSQCECANVIQKLYSVSWLDINNCPVPEPGISHLFGNDVDYSIQQFRLRSSRSCFPAGAETLVRGLFTTLPQLKLVHLHSNSLSSLPDGLFQDSINLKEVSLSNNELEVLPLNLLQPLANLFILDLSHNRIIQLDPDTFKFNAELTKLDLGNNSFASLPSGLFRHNSKLESLSLQGNRKLSFIAKDAFQNLISLNELDLNGCNLAALDPAWFDDMRSLTILKLSRNALTSLADRRTFLGLKALTELYLNGNQLAELTSDALESEHFPNLMRLDLSHNQLTVLPAELLDSWNETQDLLVLLAGNPWECSCRYRALLELPHSPLREQILDFEEITCKEGKRLWETKLDCATSPMPWIAIVVVTALLTMAFFVAFLVCRFRKALRAWAYNRGIFLTYVTRDEEEEGGDEQIYDAFVSFSHKDEDFVVQQLVPELERPRDGEPAYRLCLHYRDWLAGEWIPDQIRRSVGSSKRTVIILSEHFLDSLWGKHEFRIAYQQLLMDKRMRLIIIVKGDLPPEGNMDDELKSYLSFNTYLKWGDPWFWDRLRYALPHKGNKDRSEWISQHKQSDSLGKTELNQLPPLPLLADRTNHQLRVHVNLPQDIEMSLTPDSSASSTAPFFPNTPTP